MKNLKKILLRIITILTLIVFLTSVSFFTYNKKVVNGAIFETIGFGTSALGALVAAYFATAGINFSGSADTDGNFLGNYVSNWVKNSPSYASNPYFDSNGDFIGSSDDLSVVQNNDNNVVSLIFGKEFAIWLETLKQVFVSDNSLSVGQTNIFHSEHGFSYDGNFTNVYIEPFQYSPSYQDLTTYSFYSYRFSSSQTYYHEVQLSSNLKFELVDTGRYFDTYFYDGSQQVLSTRHIDGRYASGHDIYLFMYTSPNSTTLGVDVFYTEYNPSTGVYNVSNNLGSLYLQNYQNYATLSGMSLDGTLTDGYSDFEDAINQDLTNADEEEVAVVDVGEFPETLDVNDILDGILDKIISGTLNPTYEGTRENMGEAEEETEGEKPFVPEVPEGWVIVDGLEDFFPFCIPWDLYNIIAVLNVPPEAPRFEYEISFGNESFEKEKVIVDLSPFNTVASIFRIMMAVGFVVFLIIKTRDLIRG